MSSILDSIPTESRAYIHGVTPVPPLKPFIRKPQISAMTGIPHTQETPSSYFDALRQLVSGVQKRAADAPVATRLKKKQRGFYTDPSPGFYGVKDSFEKAKNEGKTAALAKFALLMEADPVKALTGQLQNTSEGLVPTRRARHGGGGMVFWTENRPALGGGGTLDRSVAHNMTGTESFGGV